MAQPSSFLVDASISIRRLALARTHMLPTSIDRFASLRREDANFRRTKRVPASRELVGHLCPILAVIVVQFIREAGREKRDMKIEGSGKADRAKLINLHARTGSM